ncbi:MAG: murein biosynthesis integral membrane protein MurJ [Acidobacteriota bacterium]|nr:murein biosynthesis integral membrane protein MurJ [Acidobacteriota bacterium]
MRQRRGAATLVAAGILLSRLAGFVRDRFIAHYLGGTSEAADAFRTALRIPNFLQNLFGEGVLSASFIPVYAGLLARDEQEEAGRVAGGVLAILTLVTSVLVLLGMLGTPLLVDVIAYGFHGAKRELTIRLVRIVFPGVGLLVISAWCLGVLNSHRRFFLSYSVGVVLNAAMLVALIWYGPRTSEERLTSVLAVAYVIGSALQFAVQLPVVLRLIPGLRIRFGMHLENVRTVIRNFGPVFLSRGVVQISGFIDSMLASPVDGGVSMLGYVSNISVLPVSLFGMSVSASELPEMSRALGGDAEVAAYLRKRLVNGLRRITFLVVPSAVAFVALGDQIIGAIYQTGKFTSADTILGWSILAGAGVGLLASTQGRLYASTFYALKDTRTPLRFAILRIVLTTLLGYLCVRLVPGWLGVNARWGIAGLTASAGVSGWIEFLLLRRALSRKIGAEPVGVAYLTRLWVVAALAAAAAWLLKVLAPLGHRPVPMAIATLLPFGAVYLLLADPAQTRRLLSSRHGQSGSREG